MRRQVTRALVTGGAGFIGSNVVEALLSAGSEVAVLDSFLSGYESNVEGLPVRLVRGDVRDARAVADSMEGCDTVFHLAASVGNARSIRYPIEDSEINVLGTLQVLEAARHSGVSKVVFSSSAGIFGELKFLPIAEDHPVEPDSPYGASKLAAEKMCLAYSKLYDLECVCLRYFNVYGPHQRYDAYGNVIPIFVHRILRGEPVIIFGDGEQTRDFVSVHDVVQANLGAAMTGDVSGPFNIASATSITINGLAQLLAEVSGIDFEVQHGPSRAGDVRHSIAAVHAAHAAFGYEPRVELASGLAEYVAWAKADTA